MPCSLTLYSLIGLGDFPGDSLVNYLFTKILSDFKNASS